MSPNIAIVVLDSLRYDYFLNHFDWVPGERYSNAYSTSHWTIPAHASLFTGKYASEAGAHVKSPSLDYPESTIAELLSEAGYRTRFFSANGNMTCWDGWDRGFDEFIGPATLDPKDEGLVDWTKFSRENKNVGRFKLFKAVSYCISSDCPTVPALKQGYRYWGRSRADGGTEDIAKRVRSAEFGEREFLVINLMETHTPYHPPPTESEPVSVTIGDAFAGEVENDDRIRAAYLESVRYLSDSYHDLFQQIIEEFDYVITLSDHGEMLGEDEMWNHGYGLYPELTRIPLVVSGYDVDSNESDNLVSILDVHKTIADLAGVEPESRGKNLLKPFEERAVLAEYNGFLPSHLNQFERKGVSKEVFDRHDPPLYAVATPDGYAFQTHTGGISTDRCGKQDEIEKHLKRIVETLDIRPVDTVEPVDEDVQQQLKDLGYA